MAAKTDSLGKNDVSSRRRAKRIREKGSQTDDDLEELPDYEGDATLKALDDIRNKLESLLLLKPAVDDLKSVIAKLTEENKQLMESLNFATKEIQEIKNAAAATEKVTASLRKENDQLKAEVDKLVCRNIRLEAQSRRSNFRVYGVRDSSHETPAETEQVLRNVLIQQLQIPEEDVNNMSFDRVHRISNTRAVNQTNKSKSPRPIIAKASFYQDKEQILSYARSLPKGSKIGVASDFPKEIANMHKKLYPILKAAKAQKKKAFFNVDKLIIEGQVYRGKETKDLPLYGKVMLHD